MKVSSGFVKLDCPHCLKKTWHFNEECPCQTLRTKPLLIPSKPISYSPKEDIKVPFKAPPMKREAEMPSLLGSVFIPRPERSREHLTCKGCGVNLNSFSQPGSIIAGLGHRTIDGVTQAPVLGTIETPWGFHVIGGEAIHTIKRISFMKRAKGRFCSSCAGCSRKITDSRGNEHPLIKIDPVRAPIGDEKYSPRSIPSEIVVSESDRPDGRAYNALMHHEKSSSTPPELRVPARSKRGSYGSDYIGRR